MADIFNFFTQKIHLKYTEQFQNINSQKTQRFTEEVLENLPKNVKWKRQQNNAE